MIVHLAQNIALLLSLTLLYSVIRPYWTRAPRPFPSIFAGILFGLIAIAAMDTPFVIAPGVIADARVIPVLLAGPFGSAGAALTAAVIAAAYRAWLGGAGSAAGIGTIMTAGVLGALVAARWRGQERRLTPAIFILLGAALDLSVLLWSVALPDSGVARMVLGAAFVPVGLFIPFGTLVLGMLLVNESRRHDERERLTLTQFALEHAAEALLWIDGDGRIVNTNPAAERLTGYSRAALLSRRVWELDADDTQEGWRAFWTAARAAGSLGRETRLRRSDGTTFPVETSNDFIAYRGHEWISVFVRDITDRKRLEDARDQFLATLSHELRTPLTSIMGYAHMLRSGSLTPSAAARALDVIERNTREQTRIVDELLDVSSIVLRRLTIQRRPASLATIVEAEVETARPDIESSRLVFECMVDPGLPAVLGDTPRLHQVVRNLLSNAIKFTPPGGRVSVHVMGSGSEVRLVVRDTGVGIAPAFLPHIFNRFRQADGSMTRPYGGLGIGLAIVHSLVEAHGGRVLAESAGEGRGATFTVTLPAVAAAVENHEPFARRTFGSLTT